LTVRAVPDGDEYDKDMHLVFVAVDNGQKSTVVLEKVFLHKGMGICH
jgi:hypothetical protein